MDRNCPNPTPKRSAAFQGQVMMLAVQSEDDGCDIIRGWQLCDQRMAFNQHNEC